MSKCIRCGGEGPGNYYHFVFGQNTRPKRWNGVGYRYLCDDCLKKGRNKHFVAAAVDALVGLVLLAGLMVYVAMGHEAAPLRWFFILVFGLIICSILHVGMNFRKRSNQGSTLVIKTIVKNEDPDRVFGEKWFLLPPGECRMKRREIPEEFYQTIPMG